MSDDTPLAITMPLKLWGRITAQLMIREEESEHIAAASEQAGHWENQVYWSQDAKKFREIIDIITAARLAQTR